MPLSSFNSDAESSSGVGPATAIGARRSQGKWGFHRLTVGQKISCGYFAALGIAITGTLIGFWIGEEHKKATLLVFNDVQEEFKLVRNLQSELFNVQVYQSQLDTLTEDTAAFQQKYHRIQQHLQAASTAWNALSTSYAEDLEKENGQTHELEEEVEIVEHLLEDHQESFANYNSALQAIIAPFLSSDDPISATDLQLALTQFNTGPAAQDIAKLFQETTQLFEILEVEAQEAQEFYVQSFQTRLQTLLGSIGTSIAIAILAAIFTSRAITQPLKETTEIAQRVIKEADFDLQAPVKTQDEIGILTYSLNELISSVKILLNETERSKVQLVHAEKMSSLGQLVAGIAHEINNPVNFIHGNLRPATEYIQDLLNLLALYEKHYPQPAPEIQAELEAIDIDFVKADFNSMLGSMRIGTERIREIVKSLRNFSRLDEAEVKTANLHEGIDNTLMILGHRLKPKDKCQGIEIIRDYGDLPLVDCFPGQLNQVCMNILSNAIDALESAVEAGTVDHPTIWIQTDLILQTWVRIRIRDNGPGIKPDVLEKLFDPFFTTKPVGKGTGLGLSISYQIVTEKHGGKLSCHSMLNEGTEFVIEIPLKQALT